VKRCWRGLAAKTRMLSIVAVCIIMFSEQPHRQARCLHLKAPRAGRRSATHLLFKSRKFFHTWSFFRNLRIKWWAKTA